MPGSLGELQRADELRRVGAHVDDVHHPVGDGVGHLPSVLMTSGSSTPSSWTFVSEKSGAALADSCCCGAAPASSCVVAGSGAPTTPAIGGVQPVRAIDSPWSRAKSRSWSHEENARSERRASAAAGAASDAAITATRRKKARGHLLNVPA